MAKWRIPRHKPKGFQEWEMADKNHGRAFAKKTQRRRERQAKQRQAETAFLDLVTKQRDPIKAEMATMQIGQCSRKTKLTRDGAVKCCRSAAMETGRNMYGYLCKWCGAYHITSHPLPGVTYPVAVNGFNGESNWVNKKGDKYGQN